MEIKEGRPLVWPMDRVVVIKFDSNSLCLEGKSDRHNLASLFFSVYSSVSFSVSFKYTLNSPHTCLSYCFIALLIGFRCVCLLKDAGNFLYRVLIN